jgi:hypothetical protein
MDLHLRLELPNVFDPAVFEHMADTPIRAPAFQNYSRSFAAKRGAEQLV